MVLLHGIYHLPGQTTRNCMVYSISGEGFIFNARIDFLWGDKRYDCFSGEDCFSGVREVI